MSTGNKKVYRKPKRTTEKDKRMAQLEKEIARLENENSKLKRDSIGYESRLAAYSGTPRFTTEFPALHRDLHTVANKRIAHKNEDDFEDVAQSKIYSDEGARKKKLRLKLAKAVKKSDGKKRREAMPTDLQVVACPQSKVIKKFVRDIPCPRMKPKKKREVPCTSGPRRRPSKQIEELICTNSKQVQPTICSTKQQDVPLKCAQSPICPGKERKVNGCPKCESNRIQKLECEVYQLRKEIECMKYERKETEKAIQKAILRSAKALGGKMKSMVPGSVERLLDACDSGASSDTSLTVCANKSMSPQIRACYNKSAKRREEFECCENCGL